MPHPAGAAALKRLFMNVGEIVMSLTSNWGSFLTYIEDRARTLGHGTEQGAHRAERLAITTRNGTGTLPHRLLIPKEDRETCLFFVLPSLGPPTICTGHYTTRDGRAHAPSKLQRASRASYSRRLVLLPFLILILAHNLPEAFVETYCKV